MIDTATPFGSRVARRLQEERVIWLTTVRSDGTPQPSPVWFYWDGQAFLIYSQPNTPKLRSIRGNPTVALNFDGNGQGGDIVVFTGRAEIADDTPPAHEIPEYLERYRGGIDSLGMTPETFAQAYSVPIRVTPTGLRGH